MKPLNFIIITLTTSATFAANLKVVDVLCHYKNQKQIDEVFENKTFSPKVKEVTDSIREELGQCQKAVALKDENYEFHYKNAIVPSKIYFNNDNKITGIWFDATKYNNISKEDVTKKLQELSGESSIYAVDEDGKVLFSANEELELALGSTFKLFILKEIVKRISDKTLNWDQVVKLEDKYKSFPSGMLQDWPTDSPLTVHSLAALMISRSDNTATDLLIHFLGRQTIEKQSPRNKPFLTTLEAFKIKGAVSEKEITTYLKGDLAFKRRFLEKLSNISKESINFESKPRHIDSIEWFASTKEMCRVILSLKGEEILGINPGIANNNDWEKIGYKGGSEPGVIQYTQVLKSKKTQKWYCVSGTWNNTKDKVDDDKFMNIVQMVFGLLN